MALMSGATHVLQWPVQKAAKPRGEQIPKAGPSSDCSLQLELHEDGIASNGESATSP